MDNEPRSSYSNPVGFRSKKHKLSQSARAKVSTDRIPHEERLNLDDIQIDYDIRSQTLQANDLMAYGDILGEIQPPKLTPQALARIEAKDDKKSLDGVEGNNNRMTTQSSD